MTQKNLNYKQATRALERLSDPQINSAVLLASSPDAARVIIKSLPGVKRLANDGSEAARAVLDWLNREETISDDRKAAISLYVLDHYQSEQVTLTLAKHISDRRFTAFNSRLAADAFLKSAGIEAKRGEAVAVARREAKKIIAALNAEAAVSKEEANSKPPVKSGY